MALELPYSFTVGSQFGHSTEFGWCSQKVDRNTWTVNFGENQHSSLRAGPRGAARPARLGTSRTAFDEPSRWVDPRPAPISTAQRRMARGVGRERERRRDVPHPEEDHRGGDRRLPFPAVRARAGRGDALRHPTRGGKVFHQVRVLLLLRAANLGGSILGNVDGYGGRASEAQERR